MTILSIVLAIILTFSSVQAAPQAADCYDDLLGGTPLARSACEVMVKGPVCKGIPASDLMNCKAIDTATVSGSAWDFVKGCSKGVFNSAKDMLMFFWDVMKWMWEGEVGELSETMSVAKLYLHTEYQKAYARAKPPMRESKAVASMGGAIGKMIVNQVSAHVAKEYSEFGCLNKEAKSEYICHILGDFLMPPTALFAFLKHGPKAAKNLPDVKRFTKKDEPQKPKAPAAPAPKPGSFAALALKYPNLAKTMDAIDGKVKTSIKIDEAKDIPFDKTIGFRALNGEEMRKRAASLDPKIEKAITTSYNSLNDKEALKSYYKKLYQETAEWMGKRGRPEDIELLKQGKVSEHAIAVTLVKRFKADGDNNFTAIQPRWKKDVLSYGRQKVDKEEVKTENGAFRTAIKTGPFFDNAFPQGMEMGHGPYTHMIQRDIVKKALRKNGQNPKELFDYLGTKKGVHWWVDLFDSGNDNSYTRPEAINEFLFDTMMGKKQIK